MVSLIAESVEVMKSRHVAIPLIESIHSFMSLT